MARADFDAWVPEEWDSNVIQRVQQVSAVEAYGRRYPMTTDTRHVPRSAGMEVEGIAKGGTYTEDVSENDEVLLTARKSGKAISIADEDTKDSHVDILETKRLDWATSWAKYFDNATLATTAAEGTPSYAAVPYTSVYKAIRTSHADTDYTADANYVLATGTVTYDDLSEVLSLVETGDYWDENEALVIAHPAFKRRLRGIKDLQGRPIFVQGQGGDSGTPSTLFEHLMRFSLGARTSPTATSSPTGNPLLIVCNRQLLKVGVRSGPEWAVAGADTGIGFMSDESKLKMRARRGFAVGHEKGFAVLELDETGS
ncbi:phage major capsid protein [Actinomadura miaoliensis]|uniref:Phage capsid-like C-terminal domain-containing protein n=1 Tax=Actinomadura miaoliensis TaxID=430685 RepID=A0ABP7W718_9ACTN